MSAGYKPARPRQTAKKRQTTLKRGALWVLRVCRGTCAFGHNQRPRKATEKRRQGSPQAYLVHLPVGLAV